MPEIQILIVRSKRSNSFFATRVGIKYAKIFLIEYNTPISNNILISEVFSLFAKYKLKLIKEITCMQIKIKLVYL